MSDHTEPRHEPVHPREELTWRTDPHGEQDGHLLTVRMAVGLMDALRLLRADWSELDIMTALDQVRGYAPAKTFQAALFVALDPEAGPERIAVGGAHWDAAGTPLPKPKPAPVVHRPRSHVDEHGELKPSWRERPDFIETRMASRVAGAPVFGEDVLP